METYFEPKILEKATEEALAPRLKLLTVTRAASVNLENFPTRMQEHKLVPSRHDPFSPMSVHEDPKGHIQSEHSLHRGTREPKTFEFPKARHSPTNFINRHTELGQMCTLLTGKL